MFSGMSSCENVEYQDTGLVSFFLKNRIASSTSVMSTQVFTQGPCGRSLMTPYTGTGCTS